MPNDNSSAWEILCPGDFVPADFGTFQLNLVEFQMESLITVAVLYFNGGENSIMWCFDVLSMFFVV